MTFLTMVSLIVSLAALGGAGDGTMSERTAQRLMAALKSKSRLERRTAAEELGELGPRARQAVPALIEALKDRDESMRRSAISGLGGIGREAEEAVPSLAAIVKNAEEVSHIRSEAAHALAGIGGAALRELRVLLKEKDNICRRETIEAIGMLTDRSPNSAAWQRALAQEAAPALVDMLGCDKQDLRSLAVDALRKVGSAAKPALAKALTQSSALIRVNAAYSLMQIDRSSVAAFQTLCASLDDRDETVRADAALALAMIQPPLRVPLDVVRKALHDEDREVRRYIVDYIWSQGPDGRAAIPDLVELLKDSEDKVREPAARALGHMRGQAKIVVPGLMEAFKKGEQDDYSFRQELIAAMGEIGPAAQEAVPLLKAALAKDKGVYHDVLLKALDQIQEKKGSSR